MTTPDLFPADCADFPRTLSRGRAFVYVIACRGDTRFKIGYCRDPLERWRTLQRRFFEFFDLEQGILVATDRVSEARRLERHLLAKFADYRSPAPLCVPAAAAGHTEWFRGVLDEAVQVAQAAALEHAFTCHRPPDTWLRAILLARKDLLFAWTASMIETIQFERFNVAEIDARGPTPCERALGDALDAYRATGLDFSAWVPAEVSRWHAASAAARAR